MGPLCRWFQTPSNVSQQGWTPHLVHPLWGRNGIPGRPHTTWRHFDGTLHRRDRLHPALMYVETTCLVWCASASAHSFISTQYLLDIRKRGFIKGGTSASHIVGSGEDWENPDNVRFFNDEPARHVVVDTVVCVPSVYLQSTFSLVCNPQHQHAPCRLCCRC